MALSSPLPQFVKVYEVGARDGLQNEVNNLNPEIRIELIEKLVGAGIRSIEAGSFVSPKWIPQMAGTDEVFANLRRDDRATYAALVPNERGMLAAIDSRADEVAVFAAASESFSQRNINCSISESLARFEPVMALAQTHQIPVRGYVSCVIGCPYEGAIEPKSVRAVSDALFDMGCYEVSLGDTIGVGTPLSFQHMLEAVMEHHDPQVAVHCHDTYGQALANIYASLQMGVSVVDSSVAGLGGCPYAKGSSGNVATEDLLYMLEGLGIETGIELDKIIEVGQFISDLLGRESQSKVARAKTV
ncbi:MAG: hydroxymethylglutaryl-CoA lyase [Patiriisocius sp.]|jgi:hydroxymethylglutaryl-CoA lyase